MKLPIIQNRKIYFIFSGILIVISLLSWIAWGLKPGIDFTGGSLLEIQFKKRPAVGQIQESLKDFDLGDIGVQPAGENRIILRFKDVNEDVHHKIIQTLKSKFKVQSLKVDVVELRFESVGPSIGRELRAKSYKAMIYVIIAIILYVAWAFRKVSKPVASWKYGVIAVIALIHDVLITIGVFVFFGHFCGVEINTPFIAALLTILGYSVNDTIVVFDRLRENLHRYQEDFELTVNDSINETLTRSINTSLTTLFVLFAVYFFGGETIKSFVLALIIGMAAGTYSSIFIASPLLVAWHKLKSKIS